MLTFISIKVEKNEPVRFLRKKTVFLLRCSQGLHARSEILLSFPSADVSVLRLDVSSLGDVRRFAEEFRARHDSLDFLINNAGVAGDVGHKFFGRREGIRHGNKRAGM